MLLQQCLPAQFACYFLIITLFYFIFYHVAIHIFVTLINKDSKRYLGMKTSAILLELFLRNSVFLMFFLQQVSLEYVQAM